VTDKLPYKKPAIQHFGDFKSLTLILGNKDWGHSDWWIFQNQRTGQVS
jgi:hypothetical protein